MDYMVILYKGYIHWYEFSDDDCNDMTQEQPIS